MEIKLYYLFKLDHFMKRMQQISRGYNLHKLASLLNIICTRKDKSNNIIDEKNPYMLGFPTVAKQKFIKILIDNSYTIVVIDQISLPPNPKREITGIYSPGTYLDTTSPDSNNIISFYIEDEFQSNTKNLTCIGMSSIDLTTGISHVHEAYSADDDSSYALDEALRFIYSFNPKEILIYHKKKNLKNELTKEKIIYIH